jgi:hypothetical protein
MKNRILCIVLLLEEKKLGMIFPIHSAAGEKPEISLRLESSKG